MSAPWVSTDAPATADGEPSYYSISQAAALLGVSRVSVWRWIRAGYLPVWRLGHRTTRIKREDIERLLVRMQAGRSPTWSVRNLSAAASAHDRATDLHTPGANWTAMGASDHFVQFYESDDVMLDAVGGFIGAGLRAGEAGIVIATEAHREGLEERLRAGGVGVDAAHARGQYVVLDAADTLSRFMVDGTPEPVRFAEVVGGVVARAGERGRPVRAFGEMVALLVVERNEAAALRLEQLWNDLQQRQNFSLFCAYPMEHLGGEALGELVGRVCTEHSHVIPAESYTALSTGDDRLRAITMLQQRARWLEAEIVQRQRAEEHLRAALERERAARAETEDALRLRNEFIATAAHELKTPLTSLSGQAQIVLRRLQREGEVPPERVAHALQVIWGQADKLTRLINQLLDISRLEGGRLALEREPTDLTTLVGEVVYSARVVTDRHTITVEAPPSLQAMVDALRLEQVLTNLLDNAIKYSPDGGAVEVVLRQPDGASVELSVRDHGLGIPPEKRAQIFERFYQAHAGDHRSGLGLGLYICRQIVDLHGGEICADFPSDGGTRFTVRLPLAEDPLAAALTHALGHLPAAV
jgi:excisionase family DNA binding protein